MLGIRALSGRRLEWGRVDAGEEVGSELEVVFTTTVPPFFVPPASRRRPRLFSFLGRASHFPSSLVILSVVPSPRLVATSHARVLSTFV